MATPLPHREARSTIRKGMAEKTRLTLLEGDADSMESKLSVGLENVHSKLETVGKKQDKIIRLLLGGLVTFVIALLFAFLEQAVW